MPDSLFPEMFKLDKASSIWCSIPAGWTMSTSNLDRRSRQWVNLWVETVKSNIRLSASWSAQKVIQKLTSRFKAVIRPRLLQGIRVVLCRVGNRRGLARRRSHQSGSYVRLLLQKDAPNLHIATVGIYSIGTLPVWKSEQTVSSNLAWSVSKAVL